MKLSVLIAIVVAALLADRPVQAQNFISGFFSSILNNLSNIQQRTSRPTSSVKTVSSSVLFTETETVVITATEISTTTEVKHLDIARALCETVENNHCNLLKSH